MTKTRILAFVLAALVAGAAGLILVFYILSVQPSLTLPELLEKTDHFIGRAYLAEVDDLLARSFDAAVTASDFTSVLKRVYELARIKADYGQFKDLALKAFGRIPGDSTLCRIALYACLRDNDADAALAVQHGFSHLPEVQALLAEAALRKGVTDDDALIGKIPLFADYLILEEASDPEKFLAAARVFEDPRLYLDTALLYLTRGETEKAFDISAKNLVEERFDEVAGMIAFDHGSCEQALTRLLRARDSQEKRPDLEIVIGDLCVLTGEQEPAARAYERAIELDKTYSYIPYSNLSWIMQQQGFDDKALYLLKTARDLFPESGQAAIEYAKLLFKRENKEDALAVLKKYREKHPEDFKIRLMELYFDSFGMTSERFIIRIKDLFYENAADEKAAEVLVFTLITAGDLDGARAAMTHFEEATGTKKGFWLDNARGIFEAVKGDLEKAVQYFTAALEQKDAWDVRFNRATVEIELGSLKQASFDLAEALILIRTSPQKSEQALLARIHCGLAAIALKQDDRERCDRELMEALRLDPKSAEAYRIRKKLDDSR